MPPPLQATAAYHAQQAGEKALKAFLAAHDVAFRPTHSLEELLSQCQAIEAGLSILSATGHGDPEGPWLPVGVGVHSGVAFVGAVGEPPVTELTALGDVVNTAARLASAAGAGELLVTDGAIAAAAWPVAGLESRSLELKGKRELTSIRVARVPIVASRA